MATFTVTTAIDENNGTGPLSLREAVNLANATATRDRIEFAPSVEGTTLTLTGGELSIAADLTIDGMPITVGPTRESAVRSPAVC